MGTGPTRSILKLLTGRKRPRLKPGLCVLSKIVRHGQIVGLCFMEGPPSHYREFPHLIVFNLAYFGDWPDKDRQARFEASKKRLTCSWRMMPFIR